MHMYIGVSSDVSMFQFPFPVKPLTVGSKATEGAFSLKAPKSVRHLACGEEIVYDSFPRKTVIASLQEWFPPLENVSYWL